MNVDLQRRAFLLGGAAGLAAFSSASLAAESKRQVAVTIDDGPASGVGKDLQLFQRNSAALRKAFVEAGVPAIMFINEKQLNVQGQRDERVQVLEQWLDAGLHLGNHTYSHPRLRDTKNLHEFTDDIIRGEVISRQLLQARKQELVWFRYPYLSTGRGAQAAAVEEFLRQRGYRIAPVTIDYRDWSFSRNFSRYIRSGQIAKADELFDSVVTALDQAFESAEAKSVELLGYELPQVLLIHCNEMNSVKLPETISRIRDRGYQFVSLDEAMQDPAYSHFELPAGSMGGMFLGRVQQSGQAAKSRKK